MVVTVQSQVQGSPLNAIVSGVINGAMQIPLCIALASVIFAGELKPYFPLGIGVFLIGNAMVSAIASLQSSNRYGMATVQDSTPAIVALMVVSIASSVHSKASLLPTVLAAITISTLLMGITLYCLGLFRLGVGARFFPTAVVSGFLAGTGVILLLAGLGFLMNTTLTMFNIDQLLLPETLGRWLPGMLFGIALVVIHLRFPRAWVLPTVLFATALIFLLSLHLLQISSSEAVALGLVEGGFPSGRLWPPLGIEQLKQIDWQILGQHLSHHLIIAFVGALAMLLNASGFEQSTEEEIDLDKELRGNGMANLVAGFFGGANGYLSISGSKLSYELNAQGRLPSLINTGMSIAALGFGMSLLQVFPNFLLGGLTIFLGICMLKEQCYDNFQRLSRLEYCTTILVMVVIGYFGFINGVLAGLLASFVFFVIESSTVNLVKFSGTCAAIQSQKLRTKTATSLLRRRGDDVQIVALQGFVFFGSSFLLFRHMQAILSNETGRSPRYLLLDFHDVVGIDSGGMTWITRLARLTAAQQAVLVLSDLSPLAKRQFLRFLGDQDGMASALATYVHMAADMDVALEWCEDELLAAYDSQSQVSEGQVVAGAQTLACIDEAVLAWSARFIKKAGAYLQRETHCAGSVLWRKGDAAYCFYLVDSGEVEYASVAANGKLKRRFSIGQGSFVGEIAFFMNEPRWGTATISSDAILFSLSRDKFEQMSNQEPRLALELAHQVLTFESVLLSEGYHSIDFMTQ